MRTQRRVRSESEHTSRVILSLFIFAVVMDVVTEEVVKEGGALMYVDDLVLICKTKEEARWRFVA